MIVISLSSKQTNQDEIVLEIRIRNLSLIRPGVSDTKFNLVMESKKKQIKL